jgi:hypothetical protein
MSDRRRASRFISPGVEGMLRLMQDVQVEQANGGDITVIASTRPTSHEHTIQMRDNAGRRVSLRVQLTSSAVVSCGEMLRHRVVLRMLGAATPGGRISGNALAGNPAGIAVLVQRIAARAVNVSSSGCLLELAEYVGQGAVALLDMVGVQRGPGDAVRLCRAVHVAGGAWPWRAGAEFLPLDAPLPTSVRNAAAKLEALLEMGPFVGGTQSSGPVDPGRGRDMAEAIAEPRHQPSTSQ